MKIIIFLILLLSVVIVSSAGAGSLTDNISIEANLSAITTDNLLLDSSSRSETYTSSSVTLKTYPLAMTAIELTGEYNKYSEISTLDNFRYRVGMTLIPTPDSARFSLYFSGSYDGRDYSASDLGVNTADYNSMAANLVTSLGYQLTSAVQLRAGAVYNLLGYDNENVQDKRTIEFFTGINSTLPGHNSFDLEFGYTQGNFESTPVRVAKVGEPIRIGWTNEFDSSSTVFDSLEQSNIKSFYISPRFSRPLGSKTGLSVLMSYRTFIDKDDSAVLFGYSTGALSPWVADYEGTAVVLNIKTFLIPRIITSVAFGYWRKEHHLIAEQAWLIQDGAEPIVKSHLEPANDATERIDHQRRAILQFKMPFASRSALFFEPFLSFEYNNNNSTIVVYDYDNLSISGGINIRL